MPVTFDRVDLDFILRQILMAEAGQPPVSPLLSFGLRQLLGTNNNTSTGLGGPTSTFGAADQSMPLFSLYGAAPIDQIFTSQYVPGTQFVFDSTPRTISNLIADQTAGNPAAVQAFMAANGLSSLVVQDPTTKLFSADPLAVDINGVSLVANLNTATGTFDINPAAGILSIPNVTPDGGISAPYNTWFTLFGQFFDHGLDMITKSAAGPNQELVFITLNKGDPLYVDGGPNFMVLARAADAPNASTPSNLVTPFVDQNQTYTSHPSHQVFLREYTGGVVGGVNTGAVASTGRLLTHLVFNADGSPKLDANGNREHTLPTWADIKANALKLGIALTDYDVGNVPLLATDAYGNLILGAHGLAQVVVVKADKSTVLVEGTAAGLDLTNPLPGEAGETVLRIGHAFINDMASAAAPFDAFGNQLAAGAYNGALLDAHYVAGDGRVNENIGLTTVHQIFENEHNRLVGQIKALVQDLLNKGDTAEALNWVNSAANLKLTAAEIAAGATVHKLVDTDFNGERLFQAAKFGTETQYQHLVFEEFARKVVPTIHVAGETNIHLDPAITSEFANAVYRFGHSMLNETIQVQDLNPDGSPMVDANGNPVFTQEGLIQAFTNPLDFAKYGAAGIAQGAANQVGNEIDEFVTGALRNNLLGLPLDLAAINIARGRDTGIPTLNAFRNQIYQQTHDANLRPYLSWEDFRHFLKHDASIVNFVAAYGNYVDIINATSDADKRKVALELINGTHINSVTGLNDSSDFMHSTGAYASVDMSKPLLGDDPRLLHTAQLDPATHKPVLDGFGNPVMVVAPWSTGSITGLDNVDMWIGGLAEKQSLNGSLLGSTFELIFRVQLENLQDADRLYYLPRIEGLHFSDQIENNTFADMIQTNLPGTHHLPAAIFMTPEYNIEAKDFLLKDAAGNILHDAQGFQLYDQKLVDSFNAAWNAANNAGNPPKSILEITHQGELHFNGEDYYFGNTIVLGGTDGDDKLLSGNADDDTVWADAGNDRVDGGGGNDNLFGGAGNDTITDQAGDNVVHGDAGDDVIVMGKGADNIMGGDGNDLIYAGGGDDAVTGGTGNDIIFGGEGADEIEGNQGDDWIDGRGRNSQKNPKFGGVDGGDQLVGDVGAPTGQLPLYDGNDVMIGGVGSRMKGFGGDDIMLGVGGMNKFYGGTGFDWASFELETQSVSADMKRREFVSPLTPLAGDGFRTVFTHVEGISGSAFNDELKGEDTDRAARILAKDELYNFNLVHGLIDLNFAAPGAAGVVATRTVNGTVEGNFFAQGTQTYAAGDIMLGGGGSDRLQGGGGNDILDGDAYLHVELTRDVNGEIFAGSQIIREIRYADKTAADALAVDTAVYADVAANYTVDILRATNGVANPGAVVQHQSVTGLQALLNSGSAVLALDAQGFATITHAPPPAGGGAAAAAVAPKTVNEGTDLLRNIERLEFGDGIVIDLTATKTSAAGPTTSKNFAPAVVGGGGGSPNLTLSFAGRDPTGAPAVGDTVSLTRGQSLTDGDGIKQVAGVNQITWQWQYQDLVSGKWIDVAGAVNVGATANTYIPTDFVQGLAVRLKASYVDGKGYTETVYSDPLGGAATPALLLADPSKNTGPTAQQRVVDFVASTSAYQGETVNIFIPVQNKFVDDHTASAALTYRAFVVDSRGVEHEITSGPGAGAGAAAFDGLRFSIVGAAGAVTGAHITGTIAPTLGEPANGPITVRLKVQDDGRFPLLVGPAGPILTTTTEFKINVLSVTGPGATNDPTNPAPAAPVGPGAVTAAAAVATEPSKGMGVHFDRVDLDFILSQIKMAEANHAFGSQANLHSQPAVAPFLAFGLRTVSAEDNSIVVDQSSFGQSDQAFPRLTTPVLGMADAMPANFFGPGSPAGPVTSYAQTGNFVFDSDPRLISNLIADQSANNPAALAAALSQATVMPAVQDAAKVAATDGFDPRAIDPTTGKLAVNYSIPNVTPDGGISAPYNTWFTLFGQFFDHGLDLVNKGGNGQVIIPLLPDDPLYVKGGPNNFMVLNRATLTRTAGADGIFGTADDGYTHDGVNAVTPPVDLSQVFASHPSHQVFLREYVNDARPGAANPNFHSTGRMLTHELFNPDGSHVLDANGKPAYTLPTWADLKSNALTALGLKLSDYDVVSVPLVLADEYGNVVRGPHGYAQVAYQILQTVGGVTTVFREGSIEGKQAGLNLDDLRTELNADGIAADAVPADTATTKYTVQYVGAGVAFINDMAREASPFDDFGRPKVADTDSALGLSNGAGVSVAGSFDNELLDKHYVAGDGRVNENIGLTSIHDIFLHEVNRLADQTKALIQSYLDKGDTSMASDWVLPGTSLALNADGSAHQITAQEWNGERIFQAARFGAETQYQHLVFEEFARKVAPDIHVAGETNIHLDPAVFAEFAHTVYRFGHSMLDENLERYSVQKHFLNADGTTTDVNTGVANPLAGTPELGLTYLDKVTGLASNIANPANANQIANPLAGLPVLYNSDGTQATTTDIALLTAFTNPLAYGTAGADAASQLALGSIAQVGNEIDEFVTGTLRNNLLGAPLDLAALNIARGRSEGVPTLNMVRNELYSQTGDAVLKPYDSWHEFGQFLKHPESLINFVAAYGTGMTGTAAQRRADATAMVTAGEDDASHNNTTDTITLINGGSSITITKAVAWDFMHSAGSWANIPLDGNYYLDGRAIQSIQIDPNTGGPVTVGGVPQVDHTPPTYSTGSVTGLDAVDFWIGGLAEKQNLHDSMLGSTFDFVFKLQMENLQDGDRLYYLPRIEGMSFSDQIENNSFAELIMNNTGVKHLSASVFLTPEYQIEADSFYQHNADGTVKTSHGQAVIDQTAGLPAFTGADGSLHPLVEIVGGKLADGVADRDDQGNLLAAGTQIGGTVHFLGEDNFFGNTMVLGGTDANDYLVAGQADDDTVYGDKGNDTLDGGGGSDNLFGGDGNDVLTNSNSSVGTAFHGDAGDDTIYGGKGDDLIRGGDGSDVIYGGQGVDDIVGGTGNDIIYGGEGGEEIQGDAGDDWIEGGKDGGDVLFGDVGAPTGGFPLYAGNDVMIGGVGTVMKGFSGDDIMLGVGGHLKFDGGLGFDWASFELETQAVDIDMSQKEFISALNPAGGDGFRDLYQLTEGASGSKFSDHILGDARTRAVVAKNTLDNPTLIKGLADTTGDRATVVAGTNTTVGNFFFSGQATGNVFSGAPIVLPGGGGAKAGGDFGGGNILLGGAGDDTIQGGDGDDIVDGDAWLHVELLKNASGEIGSNSEILREIRYDTTANNVDTFVVSGTLSQYTINAPGTLLGTDSLGFITVIDNNVPPVVPVPGVRSSNDGVDRIRNIERIQFADGTYTLDKVGNLYDGNGALIRGAGPNPGAADNVAALGLNHVTMLNNATIIPNVSLAVNTPGVFVAGTPEVGKALTIGAAGATNFGLTDKDFGATGAITNLNGSAVAAGGVSDRIHVQWQYLDIKLGDWVSIADPHDTNPLLPSNGATSASFTPTDFFLGQQIRAVISYTDPTGYTEIIRTAPTPGLLDVTRAVAGDGSGFAPGTAITLLPGGGFAAANTGPDVVLNIAHNGFDNTSVQMNKPIQGMFLPLTETFHDNETANVQLGYKAEIIDGNGVAHLIGGSTPGAPGTALAGAAPFMGLSFTVDTVPNAAGGVDVADGHIIGTPTNADGTPFTGTIHVRVTATDQGTPAVGGGFVAGSNLATTAEFDIAVLSPLNNAPVIPGAAQSVRFDENVAAANAVDGLAHSTPAGTQALKVTAVDTIVPGQPAPDLTWSITNAQALKLLNGSDIFALGTVTNTDGVNAGGATTSVTSTQVINFAQAPDFEEIKKLINPANPDISISADQKTITIAVKVAVTDGEFVTTQTETVQITNVNEKLTGQLHASLNGFTGSAATLNAANSLVDPDLITVANPNGAVTSQWLDAAGKVVGTGNAFTATVAGTYSLAATDADAFGSTKVTAPEIFVVGSTGADLLQAASASALAALPAGQHTRTFLGLNGNDTLSYSDDTAGVTLNLIDQSKNTGVAAGDVFSGVVNNKKVFYVENFQGGHGADTFVADSGVGDNTTLSGGTPGDAKDTNDTADFSNFSVKLAVDLSKGSTGTNYTLSGIENIIGGSAADRITANDSVAHVFKGGGGDDVLTGGTASDTAVYTGAVTGYGFAINNTTLTVTDNTAGRDGTDTLTSIETLNFNGSLFNLVAGNANSLSGTGGNDLIVGGAGNNSINGGAGADVLVGNAGNDTFVFKSLGDSGKTAATRDIILGFDAPGAAQGDLIDLSAIDADPSVAGTQHFKFVANGLGFTAGTAEVHVIGNGAGSYLVEGHIVGDTTPAFQIEIRSAVNLITAMTTQDFIL